MSEQEIEIKLYVRDLKKIETRLLELKSVQIQQSVREINYRFDLPDRSLTASGRVLRLRKDINAYLTFKSAGTLLEDGILSRQEVEFMVSEFETAKKFLEALGYVQILVYEKNRAVYYLNNCHIMLDELPYGDFVEIEGANATSIRNLADLLGLDFEFAVKTSYARIYEDYNLRHGLPPRDITFDSHKGKKPSPEELKVRAAD